MTAVLLPNGKQQFVDINGAPLVAGTVGMYLPNTLTPKNTWQNTGETVLNTNPIVLDSRGQAIIYGSGAYRQIVKDAAGNLIWDQLTYGQGTGGSQIFYLSSYTTLALADAAANAAHGLLIIDIAYTMTADYTILSTHSYQGGKIVTGTHTLHMSGFFSAPAYRIFDKSGGGSVTPTGTGVCEEVFLEWFGAVGDGSTDDLTAGNAAWAFATLAGATVIPLSKTYYFNGTLTKAVGNDCASIVAEMTGRAFCSFKGNGSNTVMNIVGTSGFECGALIANIRFETSPLGIETNGQCGVSYENLRFDTTAGVLLHNKDTGQFTEDNVITQSEFFGSGVDLEYKITSGNASFHGSGLGAGAQRNQSIAPAAKNCVQITSSGAVVYNAPLNLHCSNQSGGWAVNMISNRASAAADFLGKLTAEIGGGGTVTISDTAHNLNYFDGPVHSLTTAGIIYGNLIFARYLTRTNSNILLEDVYVPRQIATVPGSATYVLPELYADARRVCLSLFESGKYDQQYMIDVLKNDLTTGGTFNTAVHLNIDDTGAYGATTIAVDASGALSVTNANFPSNKVVATFTVKGYGLSFA